MTASGASAPAIETLELGKRFRRTWAIRDLNISVQRGVVFGFLGPNGAGKTTTILTLLGSLHPTCGEARMLGESVGHWAARRRVGFLPEKFQFHPFLTATELLRLHGSLQGMSEAELRLRIAPTLELVGLAGRADTRVGEFSKGMQQRVGLAQAVLHRPDVVILDEPASALDPIGRRDLRGVIRTLKESGTTVFLNSHILSEVEQTCDEVAILDHGRVVAAGSLETMLRQSAPYQVCVRGAVPAIAAFCAPGGVFKQDDDRAIANLGTEDEAADAAAAAVHAGLRVHFVGRAASTLEDLFVRLVHAEHDPAAEESMARGSSKHR
ncbi:MAG: ABC transporter ATP-binding protein [Armatimonadetes bacterium]|nr:ABC transporter ATP-binding protein [Armatimonadota bacterium]MDE2207914.1 ABC transporter ATP-binding protein [Armatimonadota bacterium]